MFKKCHRIVHRRGKSRKWHFGLGDLAPGHVARVGNAGWLRVCVRIFLAPLARKITRNYRPSTYSYAVHSSPFARALEMKASSCVLLSIRPLEK